jgi:hypothetical protein
VRHDDPVKFYLRAHSFRAFPRRFRRAIRAAKETNGRRAQRIGEKVSKGQNAC